MTYYRFFLSAWEAENLYHCSSLTTNWIGPTAYDKPCLSRALMISSTDSEREQLHSLTLNTQRCSCSFLVIMMQIPYQLLPGEEAIKSTFRVFENSDVSHAVSRCGDDFFNDHPLLSSNTNDHNVLIGQIPSATHNFGVRADIAGFWGLPWKRMN